MASPDLYSRIFEPNSSGTGPSGLANPPRPFVLRTRHLDDQAVKPGDQFTVNLHVFSRQEEISEAFCMACKRFELTGLGGNRAQVRLSAQETSDFTLDLNPSRAVAAVRVHLLTATELKSEHDWAHNPDFVTLACRIRDRLSTLRQLYGPGPLPIDFLAFARRANTIRTMTARLTQTKAFRRSSRSGQTHSLGGVVGDVDYQGDLAEFLPFLETAHWTGVGRQTVWGKGELLAEPLPSHS